MARPRCPYKRPDLVAAWRAGRRTFQRFEANGYDRDAWTRGFKSVEEGRFAAAREARFQAEEDRRRAA